MPKLLEINDDTSNIIGWDRERNSISLWLGVVKCFLYKDQWIFLIFFSKFSGYVILKLFLVRLVRFLLNQRFEKAYNQYFESSLCGFYHLNLINILSTVTMKILSITRGRVKLREPSSIRLKQNDKISVFEGIKKVMTQPLIYTSSNGILFVLFILPVFGEINGTFVSK